jgi:hypothetical protein
MRFQRVCKLALGALAVSLLFPTSVRAQGETGTIAGVVKDTTGLVLPGVTVEASSPALIEKVRSTATDGDGRYQIVNLRPGVYTVTFELSGFNKVRREGVELSAAFIATLNVDMRVGGLEETITVVGGSPIIDTKSVTQQRTVSREVIDSLPTAKTFGSLGALIPGVTVSKPDVGGSGGELSTHLTVHGSRTADSQILVDGMSVANGLGAGSYGHFFNNGMFQEISVETGGMLAEHDVAGVRSNLIPREGGDTFKGVVAGAYTNGSLNSRNTSDELTALGLQTNAVDRIYDFNPSFGGRILREKLWFFLSFREWESRTARAGTSAAYPNLDPSARYYTPDLSRRAFDQAWHRDAYGRLTFQATPKNKFSASWDWQAHEYASTGDAVGNAPEARAFFSETPQYFVQMSWSAPVSSRFFVEAGGTLAANDFFRTPFPEVVPGVSPITELSTNFTYRAAATATYGHNFSANWNYRASASYVTGSHAFKVGTFLQHTWYWSTNEVNSPVSLSTRNGVPVSLVQWGIPISFLEKNKYNIGLYVQDRWTVNRATLNVGVRSDFFNAFAEPQSLSAGPFVPAREFPGVYDVPNWKDLSPRLGVSYDLFGNNLGRFPVASGVQAFTRLADPMNSTVNSVSRTWSDLNGNFAPDCDLVSPLENAECGPMQNLNFGKSVPTTRYAKDVSEGFGVRTYNWEGSVGVQHELLSGLSVNGSYNHRWYGNFQVTQNELVSNADFSPYCITVPVDSRLPGGGGNQLCGFYDISQAKQGVSNNVISQVSHFGTQEEVYDGFDVSANARLPRGIQFSGGISMGRVRTNSCDLTSDLSLSYAGSAGGVTAPRLTEFCDVRPPMLANIKFLGVYPLPFWGLQFSATLQSTPGPEITATYAATNAQIAPTLGRNLAAGSNSTVLVDLIPKGMLYGSRINQVDLRWTKVIRLGNMRLQGMFDLYNALNASPYLSMQNRYGSAWQNPTQTMIGRLAKFAAQIDF